MTRREVVELLATERRVERLIANVCRGPAKGLDDLAQIIYEALLRYDEEALVSLYENEQINYFLVRIIENQFYSTTSPYHIQVRRFRMRTNDFAGLNFWSHDGESD